MPKQMINAVDVSALKAQLDQMAASQARAFVQQLIPSQVMIDGLGIAKSSLDNWWARKLFDLDVDRSRRVRLYSARDCVVLTAVYRLSGLGVPLAVGEIFGKGIAEYVIKNMKNVATHHGRCTAAILFRRSKRPSSGSFMDKNEWAVEIYSPRAKVVPKHPPPTLRIEVDIEEFVREILEVVMPGAVTTSRRSAHDGRRSSDTNPRRRRWRAPVRYSVSAEASS